MMGCFWQQACQHGEGSFGMNQKLSPSSLKQLTSSIEVVTSECDVQNRKQKGDREESLCGISGSTGVR